MTTAQADPRPLYEQVADQLRGAITSGELPPGERLRREDALAEEYGVSRQTIRRALEDLTTEGFLQSARGQGRIVRVYQPLQWHLSDYEGRQQHEEANEPGLDQWDIDVKQQGREPRQTVAVSIIAPPSHIAESLRTDSEYVVFRQRTRYVDNTPYQLADSYFPESLVRGSLLMEPRNVSAPGGVLASLGHPQARYRDEIKIRMATKEESTRLELPRATPVAEHTRTGYAEDATPLRVMVTIVPGDRHVLIYELNAS